MSVGSTLPMQFWFWNGLNGYDAFSSFNPWRGSFILQQRRVSGKCGGVLDRFQSGVQCRLTASTGLRVDRRHTPRSCGYDVGAVTLKSKEVTFTGFFFNIFLLRYFQRGLRAHLSFGLPFVIFA